MDGVTHTYSLDGDRIVAEEWGNQLLVYFYDDAGLPMGMMYRNSSYADKQFDYYLYEKDVFGNIIAIYNASGTKVASYCYDAWGNCTVLTNTNGIGTMNPFRYRGYYLDTETNLYYLQSRYYDSYVGRFINADDAGNLGIGNELLSYNLFGYCGNNPVMGYDPTGTWPKWLDKFVDKAKNVWNNVCQTAEQVAEFMNDAKDIILSNIEISAGICIGMGYAGGINDVVSVEAITRADIVGIQFKNGEFRIGHPGRSALNVSIGNVSVGPCSNTFENNTVGQERGEPSYFDVGFSGSWAEAYVIGYHYDYSVSISGMVRDFYEYFRKRRGQ